MNKQKKTDVSKQNHDSPMERNAKLKLSNLTITLKEKPYVIIGAPIDSKDQMLELQPKISDDVKSHERMCYTTNLDTMQLIFKNMTLRSSSLTNAKLNDKMEKERVGISQFAGSRYITCFSHINHESVPFWVYYGGSQKTQKVLLKFRNCASSFKNFFNIDYCLNDENRKVFFYSNNYKRTQIHDSTVGQKMGLPQINTDFDTKNYVRSIEMFDIDYVPAKSGIFTHDYSGKCDIDFGKFASSDAQPVLSEIETFSPDCLGRQKSNPWDYERESRILCCLGFQNFSEWKFIDLRLKEEFFRNLVIVMNPWEKSNLQSNIQEIIDSSPLSDGIKATITIMHSDLKGTLNL